MTSAFDLLRKSVDLYRANAPTIAGYLAWLLLPFAGLVLLTFIPSDEVVAFGGLFLILTQIVLTIWLSIFITRLVDAISCKKKTDTIALQRESWHLILPMLGVAVLTTLSILGGVLLLVVPAIIFFVWFSFAQISVILDKKRGVDALTFSRSLVQGRFFHAAWMVLSGPIITLLFYSLAVATIIATITFLTGQTLDISIYQQPPLWIVVIDTIGQLFFLIPIVLIYQVLVYQEFKKKRPALKGVEKEG